MNKFRYCRAPTPGVRTCKFKDGSIKDFEDIHAGDVFQVFEPDGKILYSLDDNNLTWLMAVSDYDGSSGFNGMFIDDTDD